MLFPFSSLIFRLLIINLAAQAILLGFQHYIVMLGTTVLIATTLVPQMGGDHVSLIS